MRKYLERKNTIMDHGYTDNQECLIDTHEVEAELAREFPNLVTGMRRIAYIKPVYDGVEAFHRVRIGKRVVVDSNWTIRGVLVSITITIWGLYSFHLGESPYIQSTFAISNSSKITQIIWEFIDEHYFEGVDEEDDEDFIDTAMEDFIDARNTKLAPAINPPPLSFPIKKAEPIPGVLPASCTWGTPKT